MGTNKASAAMFALGMLLLCVAAPAADQKPTSSEFIYNRFGVDDTFSESTFHHVSKGGVAGECDVAAAFTVPSKGRYSLTSIELALGLFQGIGELDVSLVGSQLATDVYGNVFPQPNEEDVLEQFRETAVPARGIVLIESVDRPVLQPGQQYWIVLSAPVDGTYIAWYSAAPALEAGPNQWSGVRDQSPAWSIQFTPGYAFRVVADRGRGTEVR